MDTDTQRRKSEVVDTPGTQYCACREKELKQFPVERMRAVLLASKTVHLGTAGAALPTQSHNPQGQSR